MINIYDIIYIGDDIYAQKDNKEFNRMEKGY